MIAIQLLAAVLLTSAPDLQPTAYVSPSGTYELFVDPSARDGSGSSRCRLTHGGQEVWASELPFTFQDAVVSDAGVVAGYSKTAVGEDFSRQFVVTILSARGEVAYEERQEMQRSRFLHHPPDPRARGMLHHPELDRMTLRIADPDVNRRSESWWIYDLAGASLIRKTEPWSLIEETEPLDGYMAATGVPDTPLTLVHWQLEGPGELGERDLGARFAVLDQELAVIWSLELPDDYTAAPDSDETYGILKMVREHGAILSLDDRRFELWLVKDGQRATFSVEPGVSNDPPWVVSELSRRPFEPIAAEETPQAAIPSIELRLLGTVQLGETAASQPIIRGVQEFTVFADGRVEFVRWEDAGRHTLVKLDPDGQIAEEVPFDSAAFDVPGHGLWTPLASGDWLLVVRPDDEPEPCRFWRMSRTTGRAVPMGSYRCLFNMSAAAGARGIVTLDRHLSYRDLEGRAIWGLSSSYDREPSSLFSPEDVAVDDEGRCAVIDNIRHSVQVWNSGGEFEQFIDLDEVLPEPANYPSGISPDLDDGWLIHDFNAPTPIWRLARDGTVITGFTPRFANGSTVDELPRNLRRERDGRLWTTDSTAFLRLDEAGQVDLTIGPGPDASALSEAANCHIDHHGRVLVQDARTRAVHVFDSTGRKQLVCAPDPADVSDLDNYFPHYTVRDDGGILIELGMSLDRGLTMLEFAPDGTRLGRVEPELGQMAYQPGLGTAIAGGRNVQRITASGEVLATISHHEDGMWLNTPQFGVGPDGSFVVADSLEGEDSRRLSIFDAEATREGAYRLPLAVVGDPAFGGEWVVLRGFGAEVFLVRIEDGQAFHWSAATPAEEEGGTWQFGFSPEGNELWAVAKQSLRLYRYALPTSGAGADTGNDE